MPIPFRSVLLLAATFIATGALWSGEDGIGPVYGGIVGAIVFGALFGLFALGRYMSGRRS
jgi:hypothetical protein